MRPQFSLHVMFNKPQDIGLNCDEGLLQCDKVLKTPLLTNGEIKFNPQKRTEAPDLDK